MSKPFRILLALVGAIGVGLLALWPGAPHPRAYANVTLISFTANSVPDLPEIFVQWETGTEVNTAGFFVNRSDSACGPFTRKSDIIFGLGDQTVGALYDWQDTIDIMLSHTYYYKLEEIDNTQLSTFYGPIMVTAGMSVTLTPPPCVIPTHTLTRTPTRTPTHTPTLTPQPSATPTTRATSQVEPTTSNAGGSFVTPQLATGATVTPRPTTAGSVASNPVPVNPVVDIATATLAAVSGDVQPFVSVIDTPLPAVPNAATTNLVTPAPTLITVAQAPDPTLVPAGAGLAQIAPAVVIAEATPPPTPADSTNFFVPLLLIAGLLFLGGGLVILLRARK